ncbi:hypothetical protein ACA910_014895 [Epithemia clementina (nom. ined.)]
MVRCTSADNVDMLATGELVIRKAVVAWRAGQQVEESNDHRGLDFAQCRFDSIELEKESSELHLAVKQIAEETEAKKDAMCSDNLCIVDENTFTSTPKLVQACLEAGGIIYEFDVKLECNLTAVVSKKGTTISFQYLNTDKCAAAKSCNADDVRADAQQYFDGEISNVEAEIGDPRVVRVDCVSKVTPTTSSAKLIAISLATHVMSAAVMFLILMEAYL